MKTIKNILLALLAVVIVVGGTYTAIQWDAIVGKWQTEADREVFKQTTTYSEVAASFWLIVISSIMMLKQIQIRIQLWSML